MTNSVFSDDVCRLCVWPNETSFPIFGAAGEHLSISEKINAVLPFTVSRNDQMPQMICKDCIYKVEIFYDFSYACVRSNEKLKQCLVEERHPVIYVDNENEEDTFKSEPDEDPIALEFEEEQITFNSSNMENTCGDLSAPALIFDDGTNQDTEPVSLLGISLCEDSEECLDISSNEVSSSHTAEEPFCNAEINLSINRDKQQKTRAIPCLDKECPTIQDAVFNDHRYGVATVPGTNVSNHSPQFTCCTCERSFKTAATLGRHKKSKYHKHNIFTLKCGSGKNMNRIDRKSNDREEIHKQMSCTKEKINDCDLHPKHMDDKTNYSEENCKQMTEPGGKPKRMRRSPYSESTWLLGEHKRRHVSK